MNAHEKILMVLGIAALLIMSTPGALLTVEGANPPEDGTDHEVSIDGNPGGGGGFSWKTLHGFVMAESGAKVDEKFNVTICEDVKFKGDKWETTGNVFGELKNIEWDENPEPEFTISDADFDKYKEDDELNMTVYILGEYYRENPHNPDEQELRQAYKEVRITRPNNAPTAVAMITNSDENENGIWDNWTTIESNDDDELVYFIDSEGLSVKVFLNASASTDIDGDNITQFAWDLHPYGSFGDESREQKMNTSVFLGEGDHTLGLMVGDGDKLSKALDIKIIIKQPIRYPDLTVQEIQVQNKNGEEEIFKGDRCAILAHVKNIGDNDTTSAFDVYFEYWYHDINPDPVWEELGTIRITETLGINGLKLVEYPWDTGNALFTLGNYSFRASADWPNDEMKELREQNNRFPPDGEEEDIEEYVLQEEQDGGDPDIIFVKVEQSKTDAVVNEVVWINITLKNEGTGNARYVDVYYYVDGAYVTYKTIDTLETGGVEETVSFVFSGNSNNTSPGFKIELEIRDDGEVEHKTDPLYVRVTGGGGGGGSYIPPDTTEDDGGGLDENVPIIIVAVVIVAGLGGAGFFFMRKKDEDVW